MDNIIYLEHRGYNPKNESGMSHKFYAMEKVKRGNYLVVRITYGKIGKVGRVEEVTFGEDLTARGFIAKKTNEKFNKGYQRANKLVSKLEELFG